MVIFRLYIFVKNSTEVILRPSLWPASGSRLLIYPIIGDANMGHLDAMLSARFFHCTLNSFSIFSLNITGYLAGSVRLLISGLQV